MMLQTGELTVDITGGLKNSGTTDTETEFLIEGAVQIHGLHKGEVEGSVTAAAAAGRTGHFFGELFLHAVEKLLRLSGKLLIFLKNCIQFRAHHHNPVERVTKTAG
jgi:hypothetical protein